MPIKKNAIWDVVKLVGIVLLLALFCRMWPVVFLAILAVVVCALKLLHDAAKAENVPPELPAKPIPPEPPETETTLNNRAFGLLEQRITQALLEEYPNVRWVWAEPDARKRFASDEQLDILTNQAGGYGRFTVYIYNLQFVKLAPAVATQTAPVENEPDESPEPEQTNYTYLAFEWVQAHLPWLNEAINETLALGEDTLLITADRLPIPESWEEICAQLLRNGFQKAVCDAEGIVVAYTR